MAVRWTRRRFLSSGAALAGHVCAGSSLLALGCDLGFYGTLQPRDENGLRLPRGFRSRVLARSGERVGSTGHVWHGWPDGGAVFEMPDGWVYVSNAELWVGGGVSALRFDHAGQVVDAYPICTGTRRNCAGGATPWGTWLSCEEVPNGLVYECDPAGVAPQVARPALGRFNHEAVAADPVGRRLYLTEDRRDGRLYRFTPDVWGDLTSGLLEVAEVRGDRSVVWHEVTDPSAASQQTRHQVPHSTAFAGGEGIDHADGHVFFTTKVDNRVWDLDLGRSTIELVYERATDPIGALSGVDNLVVTPRGDLLVAEDGGDMELVMIDDAGLALPLLRVEGQPNSELAGPAFDPTGQRLYFSSQRGSDGRGVTYEVHGPFMSRRRNALGPPR